MSYLVIDDVSTYTPPQNTSLIYSEDEVYKYKTSEGGSGTIAANVLPLLAVELTDIPCLVFTEDLTTALAKNIADTDNMTIALANRASTNYLVDIAKRKVDKTDFLSAFSRTGEAIDGLASDLASEASTRSGADSALSGRLDTVEGTLPTKVDKVTGSSLVADTEITKLATYPADYATVEASIAEKQTAAQVSAAIAAVIADYYTGTQVDTKIAAAVASVFKYMGALSDYTDLPASDAEGLAVGHVYHVGTKDNKTVNAEYAWNGSAWEELGSIIDLSAYYTSAQTDSAIAAAIAQEVSDRNTAIAAVSSVAEGLDGRLTTAEGEIDVLQAATAGYDGTSTVAAAISAAQSAAESTAAADATSKSNAAQAAAEATAAADATSKANAAETAAKTYADGLDAAMDARVDVLEAATAGYDGTNTVAADISAEEAARKEEILSYNKDYTAFEVYPTNEVIPAGTVDDVTGLTYTNDVPALMTATFILRTICPTAESDIIIDWDDGSRTDIKDVPAADTLADGNELEVTVRHTYTESGRYIVKFFGTKYFGFQNVTKAGNGTRSLVSRAFAPDLPVAKQITTTCFMASYSDRLLKIDIPTYMFTMRSWNISGTIRNNTNLLSVTGVKYFHNDIRTANSFMSYNPALTTTDFVIPSGIRDQVGLNSIFNGCNNLVADVAKIIPVQGFSGTKYDCGGMFLGCAKLYGTVPAEKLWANPNITWGDTSNAFAGCSAEIRAQVPVSWGGTNEEIDAKIAAGTYICATKKELNDLDTAMDARVDVLEAATAGFDGTNTVAAAIAAKGDPIEVVILGSGTAQAPQAVSLTPGKWYVAKAPFTGTLPASAAEGTYIKVSVAVGGDLRRVVAATGETINGSQNPCALGITGEGIALNGESYYFMKVGTDWVIL